MPSISVMFSQTQILPTENHRRIMIGTIVKLRILSFTLQQGHNCVRWIGKISNRKQFRFKCKTKKMLSKVERIIFLTKLTYSLSQLNYVFPLPRDPWLATFERKKVPLRKFRRTKGNNSCVVVAFFGMGL